MTTTTNVTQKAVQFFKIARASQSYGRGVDSTTSSARWEVRCDGKIIGYIWARPTQSFRKPVWECFDSNFRSLRMKSTLGDAKRWIEARLDLFTTN